MRSGGQNQQKEKQFQSGYSGEQTGRGEKGLFFNTSSCFSVLSDILNNMHIFDKMPLKNKTVSIKPNTTILRNNITFYYTVFHNIEPVPYWNVFRLLKPFANTNMKGETCFV